jgi:hypothetical protein
MYEESCLLVASYYLKVAYYWYQVKQVDVVSAHFIKSCIRLAVRQVVFIVVQ